MKKLLLLTALTVFCVNVYAVGGEPAHTDPKNNLSNQNPNRFGIEEDVVYTDPEGNPFYWNPNRFGLVSGEELQKEQEKNQQQKAEKEATRQEMINKAYASLLVTASNVLHPDEFLQLFIASSLARDLASRYLK